MDPYLRWLERNKVSLFHAGNSLWRTYQRAIVPACLKPIPVDLTMEQVQMLLHKSGALFARYFTRTFDTPTAFWYSSCREYSFDSLSRKVRAEIRKAHEMCAIKKVAPAWMAQNGYACYESAHARYSAARPDSRKLFEAKCLACIDGPFDFWGAFAGQRLIGFAKFVVGNDYAAGIVLKLDPHYLHFRPGYGLRDVILRAYACDQHKEVVDGFRSIAHDTNMHDFLLKFGYSRVYCDMKVVYRPSLRFLVNLSYPFKTHLNRLADTGPIHKMKSMLAQEEIRRSFL